MDDNSNRDVLNGVAMAVLAIVAIAGLFLLWPWRAAPVVGGGLEPPPPGSASPSLPDVPTTLLAAGDIADCGTGAAGTARLIDDLDGVVAALGDLAYPDGSPTAYADCYVPTWGRFAQRTRPTQGNHDVRTAGAAGYYGLFGPTAGPEPQGYYSYDLGAWHIVVLNSNCAQVGGCDPGSPQVTWLKEDLAATTTGNILAYFHHPRFSTGQHGDNPEVGTFWDVLHDADADVILSGHDHDYQRFMPLSPDGTPAPDGIRQFVVGTGGADLRSFRTDRATVEYRQHDQHGILRLDLEPCGYRWTYLPVDGGPPLDTGTTDRTC